MRAEEKYAEREKHLEETECAESERYLEEIRCAESERYLEKIRCAERGISCRGIGKIDRGRDGGGREGRSACRKIKGGMPGSRNAGCRRWTAGAGRLARGLCAVLVCILLSAGCGKQEPVNIRVGSLKGPTSMGILFLMDKAGQGQTEDSYEFRMATGADELLPLMVKGELDIALVPANVAAVLYQKMDGGVAVVDINTLGVLSLVTGTADVKSVADLKGRTIYLTGKGTTPEASLRYILQQNGLAEGDYTLEFKSEATEVAAVLAEDPSAVGLLPQPFVTAALMQNEALKVVLDMNEEWGKVQGSEGGMVTGVTVVRREFLEAHEAAVKKFLEEHRESTASINGDADTGAALAVEAGIVAKEPIAKQAIPQCNITCITGSEMKQALSGYLAVLADFNAELVGGAAPGDDFYYLP